MGSKRKHQMVIVKVQVPITSSEHDTSDPLAGWLIYPEDRHRMGIQYGTKKVLAALNGDLKGYFEAKYRYNKDGGAWEIGARVEDEEW